IVTVQKLAGHSSPVTTARYDRRGEETKRNAVQKLEF
ncbi:integrase, partial [Merismopedia glauca CCAP 1448/3]